MKELFREIATHPAAILIGLLLALVTYLDRPAVDQVEKKQPIIECVTPAQKTTDDIDRDEYDAIMQRLLEEIPVSTHSIGSNKKFQTEKHRLELEKQNVAPHEPQVQSDEMGTQFK